MAVGFTAAIVAGGRGERLRPYTDVVPKPALPVGPRGLPLIIYTAAWLASGGAGRIAVLAGYRWEYLYSMMRGASWLGVPVEFSVDGGGYTGTGGALSKARREGLLDGVVVVWYGDIVAEVDPAALAARASGGRLVVAVAGSYRVPVGVARLSPTGSIARLEEKPELPVNPTIGVAALPAELLDSYHCMDCDFYGDIVPAMVGDGVPVEAWLHRGPWDDLGSMERLAKFRPEAYPRFWRPAHEMLGL